MIVETGHPRFGTVRQLRSPVRVGVDGPDYVQAPRRGEHQDEVLRDVLGYDGMPDRRRCVAQALSGRRQKKTGVNRR